MIDDWKLLLLGLKGVVDPCDLSIPAAERTLKIGLYDEVDGVSLQVTKLTSRFELRIIPSKLWDIP